MLLGISFSENLYLKQKKHSYLGLFFRLMGLGLVVAGLSRLTDSEHERLLMGTPIGLMKTGFEIGTFCARKKRFSFSMRVIFCCVVLCRRYQMHKFNFDYMVCVTIYLLFFSYSVFETLNDKPYIYKI